MQHGLNALSIGSVGVVATEVVPNLDLTNVVQVVVQILIGIVTLIGLFKKKTPKTNNYE